ncbi:MAG: type II secretion system protein GspK [Fimbriimonas sp.]|nr:type II secretion system protein GspK [Fimbriimonas sp.]
MHKERGTSFVFVLASLAAIMGVLAAVASTSRLDVKATSNRVELIKARMACFSAIQRYLCTVASDYSGTPTTTTSTSGSTTAQQTGATTLQDDWAQLGSNGDERVVVGDSWFRMQVVDASSFLNSSTLTTAWLNNLPLSQQQIDAYSDYTSAGETPLPDGGKDQYYNALQVPYNAKLAPLDTLDELLNVRYFTAQSIYLPQTNVVSTVSFVAGASGQQPALSDLLTTYSYSPNVRPGTLGQQQARINVNTATQAQLRTLGLSTQTQTRLLANRAWANLGAILRTIVNVQDQRVILDNLTTTTATRTAGLINLNTASQNVLSTVPNLTPDMVQAIIQQQQTGLTSLSGVLSISGFTGNVLASTIQYFTVQSSTFIVRVVGYSGSTSVAMEATVDITNNTPKLVRIADVPYTDVIGRWNWNQNTSTETVLKEAS